MKNSRTAIVSVFATAIAIATARAEYPWGWATRSMREMEELRRERARERAERQAGEAASEESRRNLAATALQLFADWPANGGRGCRPVRSGMRLPNPFANTPETLAFFARHPEAVWPCDPTKMAVVPNPETAAAAMRMANECTNGSVGGAMPFLPARFPMSIP